MIRDFLFELVSAALGLIAGWVILVLAWGIMG